MRTRYRKILVAAGATLASMALLASAADAATPAAPYEDFAGCQSELENEHVASCARVTFTGGHLRLGTRNIPITTPVVLRGDLEQRTQNFNFNDEGGILPVKQTVDGGLFGTTGNQKLNEILGAIKAFKVHATIESAGKPSSFAENPFIVPVKVHLENPFLGSTCYIGSDASPIALGLTTETTNPPSPTAPITGQEASEFESEAERPRVKAQSDGILVDNGFAVPAASGCEITVLKVNVDKYIDASWGLPAAAGTSEAIFDFGSQLVPASVVYP